MAFCGLCGNQIPSGAKFCPKCGGLQLQADGRQARDVNIQENAAQTSEQTQVNVNMPPVNDGVSQKFGDGVQGNADTSGGKARQYAPGVRPAYDTSGGGIGGMFKKAISSMQDSAQTAYMTSNAQVGMTNFIATHISAIEDRDLMTIVDYVVNHESQRLFVEWIQVALFGADTAILSGYAQGLGEAYERFVKPLLSQLAANDDYAIYREYMDRDPNGYTYRLSDLLLEQLLRENYKRMWEQVHGETRIANLLGIVGPEALYSPCVIMYMLTPQYYHFPNIAAGVSMYKRQTAILTGVSAVQLQAPAQKDAAARLEELKRLLDSGLITEAEYTQKRADILASM